MQRCMMTQRAPVGANKDDYDNIGDDADDDDIHDNDNYGIILGQQAGRQVYKCTQSVPMQASLLSLLFLCQLLLFMQQSRLRLGVWISVLDQIWFMLKRMALK